MRLYYEDEIDINFETINLEPKYNDIYNSFKGTLISVEVNNKLIEIKVIYGYIGDDGSE